MSHSTVSISLLVFCGFFPVGYSKGGFGLNLFWLSGSVPRIKFNKCQIEWVSIGFTDFPCCMVFHCVYYYMSILLLMDIWVVSSLGKLQTMLLWAYLYMYSPVHTHTFLQRINLTWSNWVIWYIYLLTYWITTLCFPEWWFPFTSSPAVNKSIWWSMFTQTRTLSIFSLFDIC